MIDATDQNSQPLKSVTLDVGGFAPTTISEDNQNLASLDPVLFGNAIALTAYDLDGKVLSLSWESKAALPTNYTIFVQALNGENQVVGQGDLPPILPTRYWQVGERFITYHTITSTNPIAAGTYSIILGWYNSSDLTRLPTSYPNNAYKIPVLLSIP